MPHRHALFSPSREYFALVVAVVVSAVLIQTNDVPQMDRVRSQTEWMVKYGLNPFRFFVHARELWGENQTLRRQALLLSQENAYLKEAMQENIRLRKLLGFKERETRPVIAAEVVGRGTPLLPNRLLLNLGSDDGIKYQSPVVTSDGLVGRIIRVGYTCSVVGTLLDRNMGVAAMLQRNRTDGIVHWDGGLGLWMDYVQVSASVLKGDTVISSGEGGIYPKGLMIGIVREVKNAPDGLFRLIKVRPSVDFKRLEEVFILDPDQWAIESMEPGVSPQAAE
jgi:rod shape-determining protein MreC